MLPRSDSKPTDQETYRKPMLVTAVRCYPTCPELFSFPLCPSCSILVEREYQQSCDHCGQALDCENRTKAIVILGLFQTRPAISGPRLTFTKAGKFFP